MNSFLNKLDDSINLIDIGCSDELQTQWKPLERKVTYVGFEPNKEECERISAVPNNFNKSLFLPYAVGGFKGRTNIYVTESFYCTSLLKPDQKWLGRFEFADFFNLKGMEEIEVTTLDEIKELNGIDIDIIKIDSQGLELEILKSAKNSLANAIYVETESGFHANYINESTQAEVDLFMRQNGFILFGLLERRMPLKNKFKDYARSNAQVLWCECKWMRDLITVDHEGKFQELNINRSKALKYLLICAVNGVYDYGYEYARIFHKYKLIDDIELEQLSDIKFWQFENNEGVNKNVTPANVPWLKSFIRKLIRKNLQLSSALLKYLS